MDRTIEQAYKRKCFQGRGWMARWLDMGFFSPICGVGLYILSGRILLSLLLMTAVLVFLILLDARRWGRFRQKLWKGVANRLRREDWLRREAERIRQAGETVLFPTPDRDELMGLCLRLGPGTAFHCFGEPKEELMTEVGTVGCTLTFHPWGQGSEPSREQVEDRLRQDAPKRERKLWRMLLRLPGKRYLVIGCLLLLLSIFLQKALYWRLLGSLCLFIGTCRRSFHRVAEA